MYISIINNIAYAYMSLYAYDMTGRHLIEFLFIWITEHEI